MKTLEELKEIRERFKGQIDLRRESHSHIQVIVGMSKEGIANGAREVLITLSSLVQTEGLADKIAVTQSGYLELSPYEPVVEVIAPGEEKVTYIHMTAEKAAEVFKSHLIDGNAIQTYTL